MEKLELHHLAAYLPYRLKILLEISIEESDYFELTSENLQSILEYGRKPLLRPLSDLTKEIEHNEEKFVPILELYKMSNEHNYNIEIDYEFVESWASGKILKVFHNRHKDEYTEFIYGGKTNSFRKDTKYSEKSYVFGINLPNPIRVNSKIYNQYRLHELLFKWHFDVFGLIEKGLAIDINTLG